MNRPTILTTFLGSFAVATVLSLGAWAILPALVWGWLPVAITSGSMAPTIRPGDVVVAQPHDGAALGPGTVVVFEDSVRGGYVTHRIRELHPDGTYMTQGDANRVSDSRALGPDEVVAVGRIRVPLVGWPLVWLWSGAWRELVGAVVGLSALAWMATGSLNGGVRPLGALASRGARTGRGRRAGRHRRPSPAPVRTALLLVVAGALASSLVLPSSAGFAEATFNAGNTFEAYLYALDAAVTDIVAPASVRVATTVDVSVTVENRGIQTETFDVVLRDLTHSTVIGRQSVTLAPDASTTLTFSWLALGLPGDRLLEGRAELAGDENPPNDSLTVTVRVVLF